MTIKDLIRHLDYADIVKNQIPKIIYLTGCAAVPNEDQIDNFSLFYELSHRASYNYTITRDKFPENIYNFVTKKKGKPIIRNPQDCLQPYVNEMALEEEEE